MASGECRPGRGALALVSALLCLWSPLGGAKAAPQCRDQDEQWKAHGSNCQRMKGLCSDAGYGPLVQKWCPLSCGLCQLEEVGTDDAVVLLANSSVPGVANASATSRAGASWKDTQRQKRAAPSSETTTTTAADGDAGAMPSSSSTTGTVPTTEAQASAKSTTTTTVERPHAALPENCTANSTRGRDATLPSLLDDDQVEAVLVSVSPVSTQALAGRGNRELLNVDSLRAEVPIVQVRSHANASDSEVEVDVEGDADDTGSNTTTTSTLERDLGDEVAIEMEEGSNSTTTSTLKSTEWDLGEGEGDIEVEVDPATAVRERELQNASVSQVLQKLDSTLRGKQDMQLQRGRKAPRASKPKNMSKSQFQSKSNSTTPAETEDAQVLWIGLGLDGDTSKEAGLLLANESEADGKKTTTGLQEKQLPRPSQTELEEEGRQCPVGYERVVGNVYGGDQFSGRQNVFADSKEECGRRCSGTPGCGSFEFSPSQKKCFRNSQTRPTHQQDRLDFVFCRRAPCPSFKTEEACLGPAIAAEKHSADISLRPGSYCIWSGGACQAPMACTEKDCFLPDGGLPGMDLPSWQTLWISRAGLEATMLPSSIMR